jgi:hypothetical protein
LPSESYFFFVSSFYDCYWCGYGGDSVAITFTFVSIATAFVTASVSGSITAKVVGDAIGDAVGDAVSICDDNPASELPVLAELKRSGRQVFVVSLRSVH